MDPLLEQLVGFGGFAIESNTISSLAFADDLILVADNHTKAQELIKLMEIYLQNLGMSMSAGKCASFQIKTTRDAWYLTNTRQHLATGETIPSTANDSTMTYLRGSYPPGLETSTRAIDKLQQALHRLGGTPLKPHQNLNLLSTYIIPHFLHLTSLPHPLPAS